MNIGGEFINTITIISFIISIASLAVIIINIKAVVNQNEIAIINARNERFKNAIEQLGNEKNAIVLGAIYTLHRIAKEDESYRENVLNILCSYVRDTTTTKEYQNKYKNKPSEPIQTILNILCVNKDDREVYRVKKIINGKEKYIKLRVNFSRAYLIKLNLKGSDFTGAILQRTNFISSALERSNFTKASLFRANFINCDLVKSNLTKANLGFSNFINNHSPWSNLSNANLWGSNFISGTLQDTNFLNACLRKSNFTNIHLNGVNFTGSNLMEVNFINNDLRKVNFTNIRLWKTYFISVYSFIEFNDDIYFKSFEEKIKSRIGKESDLSGIEGGYDPENPPFKGTPIFEVLTQEMADEIIKKYNEDMKDIH